jgi:ParB family chromosome partitioning protein
MSKELVSATDSVLANIGSRRAERAGTGGLSPTVSAVVDSIKREYAEKLEGAPSLLLKLDEIRIVPGRKRHRSASARAELLENIREHGLIHAVTVRPLEDGSYELVAGHNRVDALREIGIPEVRAEVRQMTPAEAKLFGFYSNLLQTDLTEFEKYLGFKQRMVEEGLTQQQVADEAHISKSYVSHLFAFDDIPEPLQALIQSKPSAVGRRGAEALAAAAQKDFAKARAILEQHIQVVDAKDGDLVKALSEPPVPPSTRASMKHDFKDGKKKLGSLEAKPGMVVYRFPDADEATTAKRFALLRKFISSGEFTG